MFRKIRWRVSLRGGKFIIRYRHAACCAERRDVTAAEKVTICGAGNPLGQFLAFMLKRSSMLKEISLYDVSNVRGLAMDLDHMGTKGKLRPNSGSYSIKSALRRSDIVVIAEGYETVLCKNEDKMLKKNGTMMYNYASKIVGSCPEAFVCIITPPINIMVQVFSEAMKASGAYNPNRIFGVSSLVEMRANALVAKYLQLDPGVVSIPVIGGVTPSTYIPLLSHARPYNEFSECEIQKLTKAILDAPKKCQMLNTSAPLSTAYAVSRFVLMLAAGFNMNCAIQTAFIRSDVMPSVKYFATQIRTNKRGAALNFGLPKMSDFEINLLIQSLQCLAKDEEKAQNLFQEIHREAKKGEFEHICLPGKPLIAKTPCPPCQPSYPTDVCQGPLPNDCCSPTKAENLNLCSCRSSK